MKNRFKEALKELILLGLEKIKHNEINFLTIILSLSEDAFRGSSSHNFGLLLI